MEIFDPLSMPSSLWNPEYRTMYSEWKKWRLAWCGGRPFIMEYLKRYSAKESAEEFEERRLKTYSPSFAKTGIKKIRNRISSKFGSIIRKSTSKTYIDACAGLDKGVDNSGSSMNYFITTQVLPELLVMGKVAVYVDMPPLEGVDLYSVQGKRPYLYTYTREQIVNWRRDPQGLLSNVLLREYIFEYDEEYQLPTNFKIQYRRYYKKPDEQNVVYYELLDEGYKPKDGFKTQSLNLPQIPLVIFELSGSLMEDIADYQVALLNIASSDIAYVLKSNFPFYVEMYDMMAEMTLMNIQQGYKPTDGESVDYAGNPLFNERANPLSTGGSEEIASKAMDKEITVGTTKGRRFPKGLDFPQFINPSPDPLRVSMEKQEQMKKEMHELLNLALDDAESKNSVDICRDDPGSHNISLELESGERRILEIWQNYEKNTKPYSVVYPTDFTQKPYEERVAESDAITSVIPKIPSATFKREMAKRASVSVLGGLVSSDVLEEIFNEIDASPAIVPDYETIASDVENGLVGPELASELRGYPKGEAEKAAQAHADRLARIADSQGGPGTAPVSPGARGTTDFSASKGTEARGEKKQAKKSQDTRDVARPVTRGEAR